MSESDWEDVPADGDWEDVPGTGAEAKPFSLGERMRLAANRQAERYLNDPRGLKQGAKNLGQDVANSPALPVGGALVAGLATGGMGALPAAAMVGTTAAGGEGWRQVIAHASGAKAPQSSQEALDAMNKTALEAAAGELGGRFAVGSVKGAAKLFAKPGGAIVSSTTAVPYRYAKAVMEDPTILTTAPTMQEVGKEYAAAFQQAGMKVDSGLMKQLTGKRWAPNDTQVGALQKIVDDALDLLDAEAAQKLPPGSLLKENQAFVARSAAAALERASSIATNPRNRQVASGAKAAFDNILENSSLPNIRALSKRYFQAAAREQFEHLLPRNKNMSPNALRSLVMMNLGSDAVQQLMAGEPMKAAFSAVKGAAMSPWAVGGAISNATRLAEMGKAASRLTPAATVWLMSPSGERVEVPQDQALKLMQQGYTTNGH